MERIQKAQIKMGWGMKHDNLRDLQNPGPQCSWILTSLSPPDPSAKLVA